MRTVPTRRFRTSGRFAREAQGLGSGRRERVGAGEALVADLLLGAGLQSVGRSRVQLYVAGQRDGGAGMSASPSARGARSAFVAGVRRLSFRSACSPRACPVPARAWVEWQVFATCQSCSRSSVCGPSSANISPGSLASACIGQESPSTVVFSGPAHPLGRVRKACGSAGDWVGHGCLCSTHSPSFRHPQPRD